MNYLGLAVFLLSLVAPGTSSELGDPHEITIGVIDFYGLRTVSESQARQALRMKEGDTPPESTLPAQLRLEAIPGVVQARLIFVCCNAGKATLYIGVEENGSPATKFRAAPMGAAHLYGDVLDAGAAFEKAYSEAMQLNETGEDEAEGQSMMRYAPARAAQMQFVKLAALHLSQLRDVLRNSANAEQRALAAQVLGYAPDKKEVVSDLVYGMSDPSDEVRNRSTRALELIALLEQRKPELGIQVPPQPFVDLLNSIVWSDRNKASAALTDLTEKRDPAILAALRERALPALVDMARWKAMVHAQAALFLLGRIGGLTDEEIQKDCDKGNRQAVISAALKPVSAN
jgi:hypothetical protein